MVKTVLITGASSGIGKSLAYKFASKGNNLFLVARRKELLDTIKTDIAQNYKVSVIIYSADLTDQSAVHELYEALRKHEVNVLINNAGFGDLSYPWDVDIEKSERMLDLNIKALTTLSLKFVKDHADKDATLMNISSVGGYYIFKKSTTYCATKFFVSSFTEGLASALKAEGKKLRAKVLAPAATESEFLQRASEKAAMDGVALFSDRSIFISSDQLAEYAYELYESDQVVGIVNNENKLELKQPIFPAYGE